MPVTRSRCSREDTTDAQTDAKPAADHEAATRNTTSRTPRLLRLVKRTPFTVFLLLAMIVIAIATGTITSPAYEKPWFEDFATGLPSFAQGRWWTLGTAPFIVRYPLVLLTLLPLVAIGVGWAESRFGTLRAIGLFVAGQVVGVLGAAAILAPLANSGWPWAEGLAASYDVGASCGALAALVFASATLPAPWRLRARLSMVAWVVISVLYLGTLDDLEHAVVMTAALIVSGWLPAFRRRGGRPTQREWRLLAFAGLITVGAIEILDLVVPYEGPLGSIHPTISFIDIAIDVALILLIANGVRKGHWVAWVVALALGAFNLLTAAIVLSLLPTLVEEGIFGSVPEAIGTVLGPAILWLALILVLIAAHGAFRVSLRRAKRTLPAKPQNRQQLIKNLQRYGGGNISWMTTWDGNHRVAIDLPPAPGAVVSDTGSVAYQKWSDVAIMLGDPIVPRGREGEAIAKFAEMAETAGLMPCVLSAGEASAAALPAGWRSVIVAEDTIVDLPGLAFTGKRWNSVRTSMNRAKREGIEFRMTRLADEPWKVLAQVRAISEQWAGDKGLPEMRFTLGTVEEALDPETYVGLAIDAGGNLHGVTSWLPVYGEAESSSASGDAEAVADGQAPLCKPRIVGWTLDLMRRREDGFLPVMEFLIASSAQWFSQRGYAYVSLSGAPLVRPAEISAGPVDHVLEQIGELIEPLYGFKSLHRFKEKFNPRHESLYLLFRDEGDLPRIGIAITRAYLPDASLRDLVISSARLP